MTDRVGVFGRSGSGKSTYARALVAGASRVLVFDPMDEYGHGAGWRRVRTVAAVKDAMRASWGAFRIAYIPPAGAELAALDRLSRLVRLAQEPARGVELLFVVEELNLSFPVSGGDARCAGFAELCSRGRHWRVGLVGVSQRIAEVSTRFRGNVSELVIFAQRGARDLRAAADELGTVDLGELRKLEPHHYIRLRDGRIDRGRNSLKKPSGA